MSETPQAKSESAITQWVVPALVAGVLGAAVLSYGRTEERQAAPGSPYYDKAVREAIRGLQNVGAKSEPAAVPALPAGFSAADHYWCEQCKTYHKRGEAGQAAPAAAAAAVPAGQVIPAVAATPPVQAADAIPPLPAGLSPADYYWCVNCKTYHSRQGGEAAPEAPATWAGVPYPLPAPSTAGP